MPPPIAPSRKLWVPKRKALWTPPKRGVALPDCPRCRRRIRQRRYAPRWRGRPATIDMASGDDMLDADGNEMLTDPVGNDQLSDGAGDECCCACSSGKKCFQTWIASWDCATQTWSGPVTDNRLCLLTGTSTGWVKIGGDSSGCLYRKYVPYEPAHCCTVNGDCSGLGDTATPALPFGGAAPTDCCEPCTFSCGCRDIGSTATVSFAGVDGIGCVECPNGDGTSRYYNFTGSLGTYTLTRYTDAFSNPCRFHGTFSGTYTRGTGTSGAGCPVDEDTCVSGTFTIDLSFNAGTGDWQLAANFDACGGLLFLATVNEGDCEALEFSNELPGQDCDFNETVASTGGTATVVFSPCVPA